VGASVDSSASDESAAAAPWWTSRFADDVAIRVREVDGVDGVVPVGEDTSVNGTAGGGAVGGGPTTTTTGGDDSGDAAGYGAAAVCPAHVVLVVDDSRMNRRVATRTLGSLKHVVVEECVDGEEALARLQALAQEVVPGRQVLCLMDKSMPKMDGDEATRRYRAWAAEAGTPRAEQAWICVLTGDVVTPDSRFREQGFDDMLTKPCPAEDLRRKVEGRINARRSAAPGRFQAGSELGGLTVTSGGEREAKVSRSP
jgi:CheY-like chemotaxis protein